MSDIASESEIHRNRPNAGQAEFGPELPRSITLQPFARVVSVSGGRIIAMLGNGDEDALELPVGTLVKVVRPHVHVFGIVEGLSIPIPREDPEQSEPRLAEINLLGEVIHPNCEGERAFRRGVSSAPCLDDPVVRADSDDTALVYAMPRRQSVRIGTVHQDPTVSAYVSIDDLLGRHFAIVGATGAGKSCALALLLQGIIELNPNGHVLLLDPHGEYGRAFGDRAELMTVDRLRLPYWLLEFEELVELLFGQEKDSATAEIVCLRQLVLKARLSDARQFGDRLGITVDTPVPYTMSELNYLLDQETGRLDNQQTLGPLLRLKSRLAAVEADPSYGFIFPRDLVLRDDLSEILAELFRVPTRGKPLCILDLSGVSSEILNVVVAVVSRLAFKLGMSVGHRMPILLICEEAHRYAPQDTKLGFEPAKRSLARIAKEGRKYGVSLGLLSQRPSELEVSILSQCSTMIAFRLVNNADQEVVEAALSEASLALVGALPLLGNSEALIVGEGVSVPMRLRLANLSPDRRPRSNSAQFSRLWQAPDAVEDDVVLSRVVEAWRGDGQRRPVW